VRGDLVFKDWIVYCYRFFGTRADHWRRRGDGVAVDVTVLGLVGGAPGGETPRVADSSAAGAGRFFHNSVPPSKLNRLGKPPRTMCNVRPFNQLVPRLSAQTAASVLHILAGLQVANSKSSGITALRTAKT
jgi:hypothetical protein